MVLQVSMKQTRGPDNDSGSIEEINPVSTVSVRVSSSWWCLYWFLFGSSAKHTSQKNPACHTWSQWPALWTSSMISAVSSFISSLRQCECQMLDKMIQIASLEELLDVAMKETEQIKQELAQVGISTVVFSRSCHLVVEAGISQCRCWEGTGPRAVWPTDYWYYKSICSLYSRIQLSLTCRLCYSFNLNLPG